MVGKGTSIKDITKEVVILSHLNLINAHVLPDQPPQEKPNFLSDFSSETEAEWTVVRERMERAGAQFIWTSGHICDREVGPR